MDLKGWDYTGRNIGPDLHKQFRLMINCLSSPQFTNHQTWGNPIQDELAKQMGMSSAGAVRTVKKISENFGLINKAVFTSRAEIIPDQILTERGKIVYQAATLEFQVNCSDEYDENRKKRILVYIKKLYEEAYCDALKQYYFEMPNGKRLMPLRATLKALNKYRTLDKWEWYLLNTIISEDDNTSEEETLDEHISKYRDGLLSFSMRNVVEKPKGHQYTPQYFEFAGLVNLNQRPEWLMRDSNRHQDTKDEVLSDNFLKELYGGSI